MNDTIQEIRDFIRENSNGDPQKFISFFSLLLFGDSGSNTLNEDIEFLKNKAENGDPETQYCLGFCYENGIGVPKDTEEAAKWYRKAVEQRFSDAPKRHVLDNGKVVYTVCSTNAFCFPQDWKKFVNWIHEAETESVRETCTSEIVH